MFQKWTVRFLTHLPVTWISFEYLIANGVKPGLALSLPAFYWIGIGIRYLDLTGIRGSALKEALLVWIWPIHYMLNHAVVGNSQAKLTINKIEVCEVFISEYINELKGSLKKFENYFLQLVIILRAIVISGLVSVIIAPLALASISLIAAYFNKLYLLDLMVRWKDPSVPMVEMRDAFAATKLLMISLIFIFLKNVFKQSAEDAIRIKRGIVHTGNIELTNKKSD